MLSSDIFCERVESNGSYKIFKISTDLFYCASISNSLEVFGFVWALKSLYLKLNELFFIYRTLQCIGNEKKIYFSPKELFTSVK